MKTLQLGLYMYGGLAFVLPFIWSHHCFVYLLFFVLRMIIFHCVLTCIYVG